MRLLIREIDRLDDYYEVMIKKLKKERDQIRSKGIVIEHKRNRHFFYERTGKFKRKGITKGRVETRRKKHELCTTL